MTGSSANEKLKSILRAGKLFEGKYRILRPLGAGSFAVVVHAKHEVMGRDVALKFLKPKVVEQNPEVSERFIKEVQIASKLKHPNVVTIFDFGKTEDGIYYMVQEFIDGDTLDNIIETTPNHILPMPRVLNLMRQVLSCLVQAHEFNIIHRDLKPSNLMSVTREGKEVIKILDFGVAKLLEPDKNPGGARQSTKFIGTPIYMSPEQILGLRVQGSSDLYSMGLIFYELLTGEPPMEAEQVAEVVQQHLDEEPFAFPSLGKLPVNIQRVILKATSRFPEDRFKTAQEFVDALEGRFREESAASVAPEESPTEQERFFGLTLDSEAEDKKSSDNLDAFLGKNYIGMDDFEDSQFNPIIEKKKPNKPAPPSSPARTSSPAHEVPTIQQPPKADTAISVNPTVDSALTQMPRDLELDMDVVRQVQRQRQTVAAPAVKGPTHDTNSAVPAPKDKDRVGRSLLYFGALVAHLVMYVWITALTDGMPAPSRIIIALFPLVGVILWAGFGHSTNSTELGERWLIPISIRSLITLVGVALLVFLVFPAKAEIAFAHEGTWGVGFLPEGLKNIINTVMVSLGGLCGSLAEALPWGR